MSAITERIAVFDIHTGELLPFSVPADFFDTDARIDAVRDLGIVPAPEGMRKP